MSIDSVVQAAMAYYNLDKDLRKFHGENPHIQDKPGLKVLERLRERLEGEILAYSGNFKRENVCDKNKK